MSVQSILVVGCGLMGRGIAQVAATGGYAVLIYDTDPEALIRGLAAIRSELAAGVQRGKLSEQAAAEAFGRIQPAENLAAAAREADFVIEAVPEDLALKHQVFRALDAATRPGVVLATNTSAKSITEIAAVTGHPQRVIGMHFFNPPHKMKLVEVIRGLETDAATLRTTLAVAARMGKETVEVNESPGFVTSRINALIGNEAFYMLMEGVASARDIDRALKLGLNHPMGPFELGDLVGWDTRLKNLEYLHQTLGEKYRPCPLMVKYVKAGRLGRKAGRGVYDYSGEE